MVQLKNLIYCDSYQSTSVEDLISLSFSLENAFVAEAFPDKSSFLRTNNCSSIFANGALNVRERGERSKRGRPTNELRHNSASSRLFSARHCLSLARLLYRASNSRFFSLLYLSESLSQAGYKEFSFTLSKTRRRYLIEKCVEYIYICALARFPFAFYRLDIHFAMIATTLVYVLRWYIYQTFPWLIHLNRADR